jgi:hypothetical protein
MTIRSRMTGAALAITLSMCGTLAACGGSDDKDDTKAETTTSAEPTTDAEPTAEPTAAAEPTAEPETDSGSGDKPSRDEVVAGYTKIITSASGDLPEESIKKAVTCFVDELYEPASAQTLQAIADANAAGVDPKDTQLFTDASSACMKKMVG